MKWSRFTKWNDSQCVVPQIWWRTLMKHQRMRQTDTREDRLRQYWTVIKRETFSAVFKPSHPDISDTTPPPPPKKHQTFLIFHGLQMSKSDWLVHFWNKRKHCFLVKLLNPLTTLSVMVRTTVVIKASLKFFVCLWNKIKKRWLTFLRGAVVTGKIVCIFDLFLSSLLEISELEDA